MTSKTAQGRALDEAFSRSEKGTATPEDEALIDRYFDEACGDCLEGRCHWGGEPTRARALADGERCGCARHEASQEWL